MEGWCFVATLASSKGSRKWAPGLAGTVGRRECACPHGPAGSKYLVHCDSCSLDILGHEPIKCVFCFGDSLRQTDSRPQVYDVARTARFLFLFKYVCFILAICTHLH